MFADLIDRLIPVVCVVAVVAVWVWRNLRGVEV